MVFDADDTMYEILVLQQSTLTPDEVACLEQDYKEETTDWSVDKICKMPNICFPWNFLYIYTECGADEVACLEQDYKEETTIQNSLGWKN